MVEYGPKFKHGDLPCWRLLRGGRCRYSKSKLLPCSNGDCSSHEVCSVNNESEPIHYTWLEL